MINSYTDIQERITFLYNNSSANAFVAICNAAFGGIRGLDKNVLVRAVALGSLEQIHKLLTPFVEDLIEENQKKAEEENRKYTITSLGGNEYRLKKIKDKDEYKRAAEDYIVNLNENSCTCPEFVNRLEKIFMPCKHQYIAEKQKVVANTITRLVKLADILDTKGFYKEANDIQEKFYKLADDFLNWIKLYRGYSLRGTAKEIEQQIKKISSTFISPLTIYRDKTFCSTSIEIAKSYSGFYNYLPNWAAADTPGTREPLGDIGIPVIIEFEAPFSAIEVDRDDMMLYHSIFQSKPEDIKEREQIFFKEWGPGIKKYLPKLKEKMQNGEAPFELWDKIDKDPVIIQYVLKNPNNEVKISSSIKIRNIKIWVADIKKKELILYKGQQELLNQYENNKKCPHCQMIFTGEYDTCPGCNQAQSNDYVEISKVSTRLLMQNQYVARYVKDSGVRYKGDPEDNYHDVQIHKDDVDKLINYIRKTREM